MCYQTVLYFLRTNALRLTTLVWCLFSLPLGLISLHKPRWQRDHEKLLPVPSVLKYTNMLLSVPKFQTQIRGWEMRQHTLNRENEPLVRLRFDSQGFSYLQLTYILGVRQDLRRRGLHESLKVCKFIMQALREASGVKTIKNKESKMLKRNDRNDSNDFTNDFTPRTRQTRSSAHRAL